MELVRKALKASKLARVPVWRDALKQGVAATIEHDRLPLRRDFRTVIDVGANRGQFALYSKVRFPLAEIYSLEPLSGPRRQMEALFEGDDRLHVIPQAAGAQAGETNINVSRQDDSSSLLPMAGLQLERYPDTAMVATETVQVDTLDAVFEDIQLTTPVLLKLDVQGFELEALKGATSLLGRVDCVLLEASFVQFYEGQALFDDLYEHLKASGFKLIAGALSSTAGRRWEQGDFLWERAGVPKATNGARAA